MIKHLQDQLSEKQVTSDQLAASRVKEQLHRTQMEQLRVELEEAKKNHTPVSYVMQFNILLGGGGFGGQLPPP